MEGIRERIFHAAQKLFVEKGYHNTSIPEIVKEAGVSTGAVYHYFRSKENLAKEIHQQAVEQFLTKFNNEVSSQTKTKGKIKSYVAMMFNWTENDPIMVEYLLYARPKEVLDKCMTICSEEGLNVVKGVVEDGIKSGELRPMNIVAAAALLSGTLTRMIEMKLDDLIDFPLTEVIDETAESIWFALRA